MEPSLIPEPRGRVAGGSVALVYRPVGVPVYQPPASGAPRGGGRLTSGREVLEELRGELEPLNRSVLGHRLLVEAEEGRLPLDRVRFFVANQLYIVPHDLRSLSVLLARSRLPDEEAFFKRLVDGDHAALAALRRLAAELGVDPGESYSVSPEAVAYTHYLAWLALYATPGEAAVAMTVNLPVWGAAVARLGRALRERYGVRETGFFDLFAGDYRPLEEAAYPIIERYLDWPAYRRAARLIQAYERMFWDAVYKGPTG